MAAKPDPRGEDSPMPDSHSTASKESQAIESDVGGDHDFPSDSTTFEDSPEIGSDGKDQDNLMPDTATSIESGEVPTHDGDKEEAEDKPMPVTAASQQSGEVASDDKLMPDTAASGESGKVASDHEDAVEDEPMPDTDPSEESGEITSYHGDKDKDEDEPMSGTASSGDLAEFENGVGEQDEDRHVFDTAPPRTSGESEPAPRSQIDTISTGQDSPGFVSRPKRKYESLGPDDAQEDLELYRPGGWHPVEIGDRLHNSRYRVVQKLGQGGFSISWLAEDLHKDRKHVALKIMRAEVGSSNHEYELVNDIEAVRNGRRPFRPLLPIYYDSFMLSSPNGIHRCVVSKPLGVSLRTTNKEAGLAIFDLDVARAIAAQLIEALRVVHSGGVAHGDVHPANILFLDSDVDNMTPDQLLDAYGEPERLPVVRKDKQRNGRHAPSYVYETIGHAKDPDEVKLEDSRIVLMDFGESWKVYDSRKHSLGTPWLYCAPEARFEPRLIGQPSDIWAAACTIYHILTGEDLFGAEYSYPDLIHACQVRLLGGTPYEWWDSWDARYNWFNDDFKLDLKPGFFKPGHWDDLTASTAYISKRRRECNSGRPDKEEIQMLFNMLESMLRYEPEDRYTIEDINSCEWMAMYGRPALERMDNAVRAKETRQKALQDFAIRVSPDPETEPAESVAIRGLFVTFAQLHRLFVDCTTY